MTKEPRIGIGLAARMPRYAGLFDHSESTPAIAELTLGFAEHGLSLFTFGDCLNHSQSLGLLPGDRREVSAMQI